MLWRRMRCHQMAKVTGTQLTQQHLTVLDYAWDYYRRRRVGPLYTNIGRNTQVDRDTIEDIFPERPDFGLYLGRDPDPDNRQGLQAHGADRGR